MAEGLYEFRHYHYRGDLDEYRQWWLTPIEVLRVHLDIVGVWIDSGIDSRIAGSAPTDLPHGSANVTWVIRWDDLAQREAGWEALGQDPAWTDAAERHPGFDRYLHMSIRLLNHI